MKVKRNQPTPDGLKLEKLLGQASRDPAWGPAFYRELLKSDVLALVPDDPIALNAQGEEVIRFVQWKRIDEQFAIPFFSSTRSLYEAIPDGAKCLVIDVPTFLSLTRGALLHLNPYSECNVEIPAHEIEMLLADGALMAPRPFEPEADRQLTLLELTDPPLKMIHALQTFFRQSPSVKAAYLAKVQGMYEGKEASLLLGLEIEGDAQPVVRDSGLVVHDTYSGPLRLDFSRLGEAPLMPRAWFPASLCIFDRDWGVSTPTPEGVH